MYRHLTVKSPWYATGLGQSSCKIQNATGSYWFVVEQLVCCGTAGVMILDLGGCRLEPQSLPLWQLLLHVTCVENEPNLQSRMPQTSSDAASLLINNTAWYPATALCMFAQFGLRNKKTHQIQDEHQFRKIAGTAFDEQRQFSLAQAGNLIHQNFGVTCVENLCQNDPLEDVRKGAGEFVCSFCLWAAADLQKNLVQNRKRILTMFQKPVGCMKCWRFSRNGRCSVAGLCKLFKSAYWI